MAKKTNQTGTGSPLEIGLGGAKLRKNGVDQLDVITNDESELATLNFKSPPLSVQDPVVDNSLTTPPTLPLTPEASQVTQNTSSTISSNSQYNGYAQGRTFAGTERINKIALLLKTNAIASGDMVVKIYATSAGVPTGIALATSRAVNSSILTASYALIEFRFDNPFYPAAQDYAFIIDCAAAGDSTNYIEIGQKTVTGGYASRRRTSDSVWVISTVRELVYYLWSNTRYIIPTGSSTPWDTHIGSIAEGTADGSGWAYTTKVNGMRAFVESLHTFYDYLNNAWAVAQGKYVPCHIDVTSLIDNLDVNSHPMDLVTAGVPAGAIAVKFRVNLATGESNSLILFDNYALSNDYLVYEDNGFTIVQTNFLNLARNRGCEYNSVGFAHCSLFITGYFI